MAQKSPLQNLGEKIGPNNVNHAAYLVRTGMWAGALAFFTEALKWKVIREAGDIKTQGWRAAFLAPAPDNEVTIQLTEDLDWPDEPATFEGTHLAITVQNAEEAAAEIQYHYTCAGLDCTLKKANDEGTKWFATIPDLFTFAFELVTADATFNWKDATAKDIVDAQRLR